MKPKYRHSSIAHSPPAGRSSLLAALLCLVVAITAGCGTVQVELESNFPVPLVEPLPATVGIVISEDLLSFRHDEEIADAGSYELTLGRAPVDLFNSLGTGVFGSYQLLESVPEDGAFDGYLRPNIQQIQFAVPKQTRSEYYEVWIRFDFEFLDEEGTPLSNWMLPSYGKANEGDYGNAGAALQAAALSACRDAMAFFSLNLSSQPNAKPWLEQTLGGANSAAPPAISKEETR